MKPKLVFCKDLPRNVFFIVCWWVGEQPSWCKQICNS